LELKQIFEVQRNFDRRVGWNRYEKCNTPEEIVDFMKHFVIVMVEELGEISRIRKEFERDKKSFEIRSLRHELVDIFVYLMQGCVALNMDLEEEYLRKLRHNVERFSSQHSQQREQSI